MCIRLVAVLVLSTTAPLFADVFSWEADAFPDLAGWEVGQNYCDPDEWVTGGNFFQYVDICPPDPPPGGQQSSYNRSLLEYAGTQDVFFCEWKLETDGSRDQISFGAPVAFACGSGGGSVNYTFAIASDQAKLNRDNTLPIIYVDFEPGVHVYRLELNTDQWYRWYIDDVIADEGVPEGAYPSGPNPVVIFRTKYESSISTSEWHHIRWGKQPLDGSGDFDTNGAIDG